MVKKKQEKPTDNIEQPIASTVATPVEPTPQEKEIIENIKRQQDQGAVLLKNILDPINQTLQQLMNAQKIQAEAIKALAEKPSENSKLMQYVEKYAPEVIKAIGNFLTAPETPPEQSKMGLFDEELLAGYKQNLMEGWRTNQEIIKEQLNQQRLENAARAKRLTEEI